MSKTLIGRGTVITQDSAGIIEDGAVLISGDLIEKVGHTKDLMSEEYDYFIDATGMLIMPGLINCHTHLYSALSRGISMKGNPPVNFVQVLEKLWWKLDKVLTDEDNYYSALVGVTDCIKSGTTTILDHHASPFAIPGSLDLMAKALKKAGLRGSLCYEVSDRDGEKKAIEGIEENARFAEKIKGDKLLTSHFGLHAAFTLSDETIKKCKKASEGLDIGFHIHVAEDKADQDYSLEKYGERVVERLERLGILGNKTIAAHCIHIIEEEMEILKNTGTIVVHNPQSNMNNAVGTAQILKLFEKGIMLGLGSDGMTGNMFNEIRAGNLIHKIVNHKSTVAYAELPQMVLHNNPAIVGRFFHHKTGKLIKDAYADIILVKYVTPTPLTVNNFWGHLLFGISDAHVDTTIVGGKVLMRNGVLTTLDEKSIREKSVKLTEKLWERFANRD